MGVGPAALKSATSTPGSTHPDSEHKYRTLHKCNLLLASRIFRKAQEERIAVLVFWSQLGQATFSGMLEYNTKQQIYVWVIRLYTSQQPDIQVSSVFRNLSRERLFVHCFYYLY
jgi:hypothetical protein